MPRPAGLSRPELEMQVATLEAHVGALEAELRKMTFMEKGILASNDELSARVAELEAVNRILNKAESQLGRTEDELAAAQEAARAEADKRRRAEAQLVLQDKQAAVFAAEVKRLDAAVGAARAAEKKAAETTRCTQTELADEHERRLAAERDAEVWKDKYDKLYGSLASTHSSFGAMLQQRDEAHVNLPTPTPRRSAIPSISVLVPVSAASKKIKTPSRKRRRVVSSEPLADSDDDATRLLRAPTPGRRPTSYLTPTPKPQPKPEPDRAALHDGAGVAERTRRVRRPMISRVAIEDEHNEGRDTVDSNDDSDDDGNGYNEDVNSDDDEEEDVQDASRLAVRRPPRNPFTSPLRPKTNPTPPRSAPPVRRGLGRPRKSAVALHGSPLVSAPSLKAPRTRPPPPFPLSVPVLELKPASTSAPIKPPPRGSRYPVKRSKRTLLDVSDEDSDLDPLALVD